MGFEKFYDFFRSLMAVFKTPYNRRLFPKIYIIPWNLYANRDSLTGDG